jgi:glycosyltransferase involved in cell wall biosynthesis
MRSSPSGMRILFLTKYTRAGASSRYRTYQYLPYFQEAGLTCEVAPLFDDRYLATKYQVGHAHVADVARALVRRLLQFARLARYDLVVIEYELLPYLPAWIERLLARRGIRYAVDYDDALFHRYDRHRSGLVRALLGNKIASVMRGSRLVTAGNDYLADYAVQAGARRVEVVPTVVDIRKYTPRASENGASSVIIGWIGSPATARYLEGIAAPLAQVCEKTGARVRLIGSGPLTFPALSADVLAWDEVTETRDIADFDIGVMPLVDGPWERGKCGFKLIQYMACAVPVVASPVGVNCRIVEPGVNGFLASTGREWIEALTALVRDASLRARMGREGRRRVETTYSMQAVAPRLAGLLAQAGSDSSERVVKQCAESRAS